MRRNSISPDAIESQCDSAGFFDMSLYKLNEACFEKQRGFFIRRDPGENGEEADILLYKTNLKNQFSSSSLKVFCERT